MSFWWRLCVFTHSDSRWVPACYSDCVSLSLSSVFAAVTLPPLYHRHFVFLFFFSPRCCSSSLSRPFSFTSFLSLSPSPFIALPVSLYLCVFRQSDTGAQRFGPTHHCDSHNRLTRENKFHSKSRILMDWAVFFLVMLFLFFHFPFLFFLLNVLLGLVLLCKHPHLQNQAVVTLNNKIHKILSRYQGIGK